MAEKDPRAVLSLTSESKTLTNFSIRLRADARELRSAARKLRRKCAGLINPRLDKVLEPKSG